MHYKLRPEITIFDWAERLRSLPYFVVLDSGSKGKSWISACPVEWLQQTAQGVIAAYHWLPGNSYKPVSADLSKEPHELLKQMYQRLKDAEKSIQSNSWAARIIGALSYEYGYRLNYLKGEEPSNSDSSNTLAAGAYVWAIECEEDGNNAYLHFSSACPEKLKAAILELVFKSEDTPALTHFNLTDGFLATTSQKKYLEDVERIRQYISSGDCYQVNYTQRFTAKYQGDPYRAFRHLCSLGDLPFSAFFDQGGEQLLSLSPERFLSVNQGEIKAQPIKGTRPRGKTAIEDELLCSELVNSEKDRAENLMIVDLLRNDIGRSAIPGSVTVPALFELHSFTNVHHLVSTVVARSKQQLTPLDCLINAFPGGSITGAPKKRAMEIIRELEPTERGPYCGSLFYWTTDNKLDSSIMIRTLIAKNGSLSVWGGGGIVYDSVASAEFIESLDKIGYLMTALEKPL